MNPAVEQTRTQFPPFVGFDSIPRLFRAMVVTEKIDGTNALIEVREDGEVWAGSRTRYITPESDNFGFAAWVRDHEDELRAGLGVGRHFGEWYGRGVQRGYGLTDRRFALFNVGRWHDAHRPDLPALEDSAPCPACCTVVPVLYRGDFDTAFVRSTLTLLGATGSQAAPGFMQPEGVVVYHVPSKQLFKYTLDKNDGHKGNR